MKLHSGDSVNKDNFLLTDLCTLSQHYLILTGNYKPLYSPEINLWVHFAIYDVQPTKGSFSHSIITDKKELLLIQTKAEYCLSEWANEKWMLAHQSHFSSIYWCIYMDSHRPVFKALSEICIGRLSNKMG